MSVLADLAAQVNGAHRLLRMRQAPLTGCTSYIQRQLVLGYGRAALILSVLEDAKVLSKPDQIGERCWLMNEVDTIRTLNGGET